MNKTVEWFLRWDQMIFWMFHDKIKCEVFDRFFPLITHLGSTLSISFCTLVIVVIDFEPGGDLSKNLGVQTAIALAISHGCIYIIKKAVGRPRPYEKLAFIHPFPITLRDYSFPSGHTAAAVTVSISFCALFPQVPFFFLGFSGLVALSRIYLGVHYPTDVMAGILVGSLCGFAVIGI